MNYIKDFIENSTNMKDLYLIRKLAHKKILKLKETSNITLTKNTVTTDWALQCAEDLFNSIKQNYPHLKDDRSCIDNWSRQIEKIHKIDGYDIKLINYILQYSQQDDFWKQNIRSGGALRRHFDKIYVKAKSNYDKEINKKNKVHII
jgi:hypothetical protein